MTQAEYESHYVNESSAPDYKTAAPISQSLSLSQITNQYFWFYVCYSHKLGKGQLYLYLEDNLTLHQEWSDLLMVPHHLNFSFFPMLPYSQRDFSHCNPPSLFLMQPCFYCQTIRPTRCACAGPLRFRKTKHFLCISRAN